MDEAISIEEKQDMVLLYSSGELDTKGIANVERWLREDQELENYFESIRQVEVFVNGSLGDDEGECVAEKVLQELKPEAKIAWFPVVFTAMAAAVAVGLWIGFVTHSTEPGPGSETILVKVPEKDTERYKLHRFRKETASRASEFERSEPKRFSKRYASQFVATRLNNKTPTL